MPEIKVAIFEDNRIVRDAFEEMLKRTPGMACTGSFSHAGNLDAAIKSSHPDVVLMDIEMPDVSGIDATAYIHEKYPAVKILIQTVFDDSAKIFDALCAGANGYILKIDSPEKLIPAIEEVYNGGAPMSAGIAKKVIDFFSNRNVILNTPVDPENDENQLTGREKEVLQLMARGNDFRHIANSLNITYETVRTHIKKIYRKLHVSSRVEAIMKANQQKLI